MPVLSPLQNYELKEPYEPSISHELTFEGNDDQPHKWRKIGDEMEPIGDVLSRSRH